MKKFTKIFTNNLGFKILALVFAVILWLVIVNLEDPNKARVFTIPVTIEHESYILDKGMTYEVQDNTDTISFTVSGRRSVVEGLSASDFKAVANMRQIDSRMERVPIRVSAIRYGSSLEIQKRSQYLELHVEKTVTKTLPVLIKTSGSVGKSVEISTQKVTPAQVTISGARSKVNRVKSAAVRVDVSNATSGFSKSARILLLDEQGYQVDATDLNMSQERAMVNIGIDQEKNISVSAKVKGEPADGYAVRDIICDPESITVTGSSAAVDKTGDITIDSDKLDVSGRKKSFRVRMNLDDYIPDGISLKDGTPSSVAVVVEIEKYTTKTITLPTSDISISGLPDNQKLTFAQDSVDVTLRGRADQLKQIKASDLKASIRADSLKEGNYSLPLSVSSDLEMDKKVSVPVTITAKDDTSEPDTSDDQEQTDD